MIEGPSISGTFNLLPGHVKARIRCDDKADIFVNGQLAHSTLAWTDVWMAALGADVSVVAVKCKNDLGFGGLIASFSSGIVSSRHWKCHSGKPSERWTQIDFDDSDWQHPCEWTDAIRESKKRSAFPEEAKWIWLPTCDRDKEYHAVYCRVSLGKYPT